MIHFKDRVDAGKKLAQALDHYKNNPNAIVLGLPRGGVVTAFEVANQLNLPLDIVVPRKIGAPSNTELAVGALTVEGDIIWNDAIMKSLHLKPKDMRDIIEEEKAEAMRRLKTYRGDRSPLQLTDKIVLLIDDGIATGATMRAAISAARKKGAEKIIIGTPLVTVDTMQELEKEADEIVSLLIPKTMWGIGAFYDNFAQTEDATVIDLMERSKKS